jgi:hypothetical protein
VYNRKLMGRKDFNVDLVSRFVADYRPFYTIHDADFKEMTASNCSALPAIILGVTNPFFNKVKTHRIVERIEIISFICHEQIQRAYYESTMNVLK